MNELVRNLDFSWFSFLFGFVAGILFWLLLKRLRPNIDQVRERVSTETRKTRQERVVTDEVRLGNDIIRLAQGMHIAAPLFSLDEVMIPVRLLPPPQEPIYREDVMPASDITDWVIPYMPDWPQMASFYNAPTMSLAKALHGDSHLVLVGDPGSGKTVALAHLATQAANEDPALGTLIDYTPVLVRAADLLLPAGGQDELLSPLITAIHQYATSKTAARIPTLLPTAFEGRGVLLLVDGLDEFPPNEFDLITHYLNDLLAAYPNTRIVTSASPGYLGHLLDMNFVPMVVANWNQEQRADFLMRWGALWSGLISPAGGDEKSDSGGVDPMLIHGWLLNNTNQLTPLEMTLKLWAAYSGDMLGPQPVDALEAYVRRMTFRGSPKNRPAFEHMCSQMVLTMQPAAHQNSANQWLSGGGAEVPAEAMEIPEDDIETSQGRKAMGKVRAPGALTDLIESGLVNEHPGNRVSANHPVICGYLAAQALSQTQGPEQLLTQPDWTGQRLTLRYTAARETQAPWIGEMLADETSDLLLHGLLTAASWLKDAPEEATWSSSLMRALAGNLQKDTIISGLKARILSALVNSGDSGVTVLLRQMMGSPHADIRQLSVLGAGMLRDRKSISELGKLIDDSSPLVSRAAILALVATGDKQGLEAVAYSLLHGDEQMRQAAAEGLANDIEEGHPTLKEGAELEDHSVRRAVIFGLARTREPWAIEIVERMRTTDSQWFVKDAASQVLDEIDRPDPRLPHRLPQLTSAPWLLEFAGERGIGVAPGKPALALVHKTLTDGKEDVKLAALYHLCYHSDENSVLPLYQCYFTSSGEVREAALNTLWHLSKSGIELPPPIQYGLK